MTIPDEPVPYREGHTRFQELCALFTSGALERDELEELDAHLADCAECRSALADYEVVRVSVPRLLCNEAGFEEAQGFDREIASGRSRLLAALESPDGARSSNRVLRFVMWRYIPYAALFFLSVAAGVGGYRYGIRGANEAEKTRSRFSAQEAALRGEISQITEQRDQSLKLAEQRSLDLRAKASESERQLGEIGRLKQMLELSYTDKSHLLASMAALSEQNEVLKNERATVARAAQQDIQKVAELETELDRLRAQRTGFDMERTTRDTRVQELSVQIAEEEKLLRADRDIRELIGARDLLMADVIDVDTRGRNKKPFGRIFYTKTKSLVFYAFDLDKQPGVHLASAFQAWGGRATSKGTENPVSIGLFYKDSASAQRWILQFDDPKVLEQIDSVFVTVEPEGGSRKPSGRQFLFAYLRAEANHP